MKILALLCGLMALKWCQYRLQIGVVGVKPKNLDSVRTYPQEVIWAQTA